MAEGKNKANKTVEELVEKISQLSVLDLAELTKALQEKLGVSAIPTVAAAPAAPVATGADQGEQNQEQAGAANQTLTMTNAGANKIGVIKALREINQNLTLMDAKAMTENVPAEIIKDGKVEEVKAAAEKLKAAGATVEVK